MRHLKEGTEVWRAFTMWLESTQEWHYSLRKVVVCLQHPVLGTFFTDPFSGVHTSAKHGELHETREGAVKFVLDLMRTTRNNMPPRRIDSQIAELIEREKDCLRESEVIG